MSDTEKMAWLHQQLDAYLAEVAADPGLRPYTKATYMSQAGKFVRWIAGRTS